MSTVADLPYCQASALRASGTIEQTEVVIVIGKGIFEFHIALRVVICRQIFNRYTSFINEINGRSVFLPKAQRMIACIRKKSFPFSPLYKLYFSLRNFIFEFSFWSWVTKHIQVKIATKGVIKGHCTF